MTIAGNTYINTAVNMNFVTSNVSTDIAEKKSVVTLDVVSCEVAPISSMLLSTTAMAHSDEVSVTDKRKVVSRPGRTCASAKPIDT